MLSMTVFSQSTQKLHNRYDAYCENIIVKTNTLSYNDWLLKKGLTDTSGVSYVHTPSPTLKINLASQSGFALSPGDYFIKAKRQMIGGYVCYGIATGMLVFNAQKINANTSKYDKLWDPKPLYYGAGAFGFIGLVCELSGISNIGKAGVSLNENGIGVKVKF